MTGSSLRTVCRHRLLPTEALGRPEQFPGGNFAGDNAGGEFSLILAAARLFINLIFDLLEVTQASRCRRSLLEVVRAVCRQQVE